MLSFGFTAEALDGPEWRDSHFLRLKSDVQALLRELTGRRDFECASTTRNGLHPGKTAAVMLDGVEIAYFGAIDPRVAKAFDVRLPAYGCAMHLAQLPAHQFQRYRAPSKYPSTYRDLALVCDRDVQAFQIERGITGSVGALCTGVRTFDEYRGAQVPAGKKSLAVRVTLQRYDATITDEEADAAVDRALAELRERFGVTLRT
jgi:phenylalanyl-tRNA synthetase beta chain